METTTKNVQPKEIVLKKKYVRPVLVTYGRLQEFTASGTQNGMENADMVGPTFMA
jgi:hypothetical protein